MSYNPPKGQGASTLTTSGAAQSSDIIVINRAGVDYKTMVSAVQAYLQANLSFAP